MSTTFKPGQTLRCTVTKTPRSRGSVTTLTRLMQMDPGVKRGLRRAHRLRQQNLNVYNRGNRDWTARELCGKIVRPVKGQAWSMVYSATIAKDLASIADCVEIKSA
jgi:hypothetical protein